MFSHRADGKKIKTIDPYFKLIPSIMTERSDSQVFFTENVPISGMDEYIANKQKEGIKMSYMDIIYAAIIRVIAEKPQLNRFAMNGRIFKRNDIVCSLVVKKEMSEDGTETTVKEHYSGEETIMEIHDRLQKLIVENKADNEDNKTDALAGALAKIPIPVIRFVVGMLKFLDKRGMMPKSVIEASPFHTSVFLTNVGSLGISTIYHHLYNFGTTSLFFAMGKKERSYVYEDDELKEEKVIKIAFVGDERICDGYYYAQSFRTLMKYFKHPELLETKGVRHDDLP